VKYTPNPPWVAQDMLNSMGLNSLDDLFDDIKDDLKLKKGLNLPPAMGEMELRRYMKDLAARNISTEEYPCFLGAGAYDVIALPYLSLFQCFTIGLIFVSRN
jgi:glycine dehydrogenase subunit 1